MVNKSVGVKTALEPEHYQQQRVRLVSAGREISRYKYYVRDEEDLMKIARRLGHGSGRSLRACGTQDELSQDVSALITS